MTPPVASSAMAYEVKVAFRDQRTDPSTGTLQVSEFEVGRHEPKNEFEEQALKQAVELGQASVVEAKAKKEK